METDEPPFVQRVALRNYKSIAECDVELRKLVLLVGPNGSGKSNFLDALRFVAESLRGTMDQALRERGGINEVRRRSRGHPTHFAIHLWLSLASGRKAEYSFSVGAKKPGGFQIQQEECRVTEGSGQLIGEYQVSDGAVVKASIKPHPPVSTDRLYLTIASGFPEFLAVFEELSGMGFYNINPDQLRDLQDPDSGELLMRDGRNVASVLTQIGARDPRAKERIEQYLARIVPGVRHVDKKSIQHKETLEFKQHVAGDRHPWSFSAQNMSDGTLRALGVLVSLFQCFDRPKGRPVPLVGIEEPEVALHPTAAGVLLGALQEASNYSQILVTSHSPELLDSPDLDPESLLIVEMVDGATVIAPANETGMSAMRDRLYTAGELLKLDQLQPRSGAPLPHIAPTNGGASMPLFPEER